MELPYTSRSRQPRERICPKVTGGNVSLLRTAH
jgi:hypothetical protein